MEIDTWRYIQQRDQVILGSQHPMPIIIEEGAQDAAPVAGASPMAIERAERYTAPFGKREMASLMNSMGKVTAESCNSVSHHPRQAVGQGHHDDARHQHKRDQLGNQAHSTILTFHFSLLQFHGVTQ
ncbi:hypothetical protein A7D27_20570 [Pseudomonas sp. 1D4]|nr:hypothetical protein A7D27_20570 [Pseudomonas sp. 1D4]